MKFSCAADKVVSIQKYSVPSAVSRAHNAGCGRQLTLKKSESGDTIEKEIWRSESNETKESAAPWYILCSENCCFLGTFTDEICGDTGSEAANFLFCLECYQNVLSLKSAKFMIRAFFETHGKVTQLGSLIHFHFEKTHCISALY